jgi:hypothetical protein
MGVPIVVPYLQWADAEGTPYAGGTITTYIAGTSTPKSTWLDPGLTALNTNPIVLNAAGYSLMYGNGDYRLIVKDIHGNLVADIEATTIVSAAMAPVVSAPTIADALDILGVNSLIAAEATARSNADSAEQNARIAADDAEGTARFNADNDLFDAIQSEQTDRQTGDANLQAQINAIAVTAPSGIVTMQKGTSISDGSAAVAVNFPTPWTDRTMDFQADGGSANPGAYFSRFNASGGGSGQVTTAAATGYLLKIDVSSGTSIGLANTSFTWFAIGH